MGQGEIRALQVEFPDPVAELALGQALTRLLYHCRAVLVSNMGDSRGEGTVKENLTNKITAGRRSPGQYS